VASGQQSKYEPALVDGWIIGLGRECQSTQRDIDLAGSPLGSLVCAKKYQECGHCCHTITDFHGGVDDLLPK
jgi:hypothetical protein